MEPGKAIYKQVLFLNMQYLKGKIIKDHAICMTYSYFAI